MNYNDYVKFTKQIWNRCQLEQELAPEDISSIPQGYDESISNYKIAINVSKLENSEKENCIVTVAKELKLKYYQTVEDVTQYLILYKP